MGSLTGDPSREEMVQLEAFRRVHVRLRLTSASDEDDEELRSVWKETASSDSTVKIQRRAGRNPDTSSQSERSNLPANQVRALRRQLMNASHGNEPRGIRNRGVTSQSREALLATPTPIHTGLWWAWSVVGVAGTPHILNQHQNPRKEKTRFDLEFK